MTPAELSASLLARFLRREEVLLPGPYARALWEAFREELGEQSLTPPEVAPARWAEIHAVWERTGALKRVWPEMAKHRKNAREVLAAADRSLDTRNVAEDLGVDPDHCPSCGGTSGVKHFRGDKDGKARWKCHRCEAGGFASTIAELVLGSRDAAVRYCADRVADDRPAPPDWMVTDMSRVPEGDGDERGEEGEEDDDEATEEAKPARAWMSAAQVGAEWQRLPRLARVAPYAPGVRVVEHGNMFDLGADVEVVTVNCVGVMGKGLALAAKGRYLWLEDAYKACELRPGGVVGLRNPADGDRVVLLCATKDDWREPSQIGWVQECASGVAEWVKNVGRRLRIGVPALGCGNGGLEWDAVRPLLVDAFFGLDAEVVVYGPACIHDPGVPRAHDDVSRWAASRGWDAGRLDARIATSGLGLRGGVEQLLVQSPALATPIRDALGVVHNMQLRFVREAQGTRNDGTVENVKTRFLNGGNPGATHDDAGMPYVYGSPERLGRAEIVVFTEGGPDTHTARELLRPDRVHLDDEHDVNACRPSVWGNPWSHMDASVARHKTPSREVAVAAHRGWLEAGKDDELEDQRRDVLRRAVPELCGSRVACVCHSGQACHVDNLVAWTRDRVAVVGALDAGHMADSAKLVHLCKRQPRYALVIPHCDPMRVHGNKYGSVGMEGGNALYDALCHGNLPPEGCTLAGTGHRPGKLGTEYTHAKLVAFLLSLVQKIRPARGRSGMALGFDQALAEAFYLAGVPWSADVPCDEYESTWPKDAQVAYRWLLDRATEVNVITPGPYSGPDVMLKRNLYMRDHATHTLALWDGEEKGGTAHYVRHCGHPVHNAWMVWAGQWRLWDWTAALERLGLPVERIVGGTNKGWDLNDLLVAVGKRRLLAEFRTQMGWV